MTVHELLSDLQRQGFILTPLPDGKLKVQPASQLTDSLREALKRHKAGMLALLTQQLVSPTDYRQFYHQAAEAVRQDCWAIDPAWLLDHPEFWEQIRDLDGQLTTMERTGASEPEYQAVLERLVQCVRDALAAYERERGQGKERAAVQ